MDKKEKLQLLLDKLEALQNQSEDDTNVAFNGMIKNALDTFAKDFVKENPNMVALRKFNQKINALKLGTKEISDVVQQIQTDISESETKILEEFATKIQETRDEILPKLSKEVSGVRDELATRFDNLSMPDVAGPLTSLRKEFEARIESLNDGELKKDIESIQKQMQNMAENSIETKDELEKAFEKRTEEKLKKLRIDFLARIANAGHGGQANRNITMNGQSVLGRYTDINFLDSSTIGWAASNDDVRKWVNFSASVLSGGGGGTITGSGTINTVAKFTGATAVGNSSIIDNTTSVTTPPLISVAGVVESIATTAAAQTASTTAGVGLTITADPAVAGSTNAGAAAGGNVTITAGAAQRLTSGNANGGNINLVTGTGIGTGTAGQILVPSGTAAVPALAFTAESTSGFFRQGSSQIGYLGDLVVAPTTTVGLYIGSNSNGLWMGSGNSITWTSAGANIGADTRLTRLAAANIRQGLSPSATPIAQIFTLGEASRGGTDTDTAGANGTIQSGAGTGTGAISSLFFQTPTLGSTGTTAQVYATRMTVSQNGVTVVPTLFGAGISMAGNISAGAGSTYFWATRSSMTSPSDGVIELANNALTNFTRLQFGGTTSSFPALGRSTTFLTQTLADGTAGGGFMMTGLMAQYNNVTTAGWGIPAIYGAGRATAQTAANASVATYTCGAADGSFEVSANVLVTTSSAESFTVTVSYTDEGNTARTLTLNFQTIAGVIGTTVAFANGAVPYEGVPVHLRVKASTAITVKTAAGGTYTGCTYNVESVIKQTA